MHIYCNTEYKCILILLIELKKLVLLKLYTQEVRDHYFESTNWGDFIPGNIRHVCCAHWTKQGGVEEENRRKMLRWHVKEGQSKGSWFYLFYLFIFHIQCLMFKWLSGLETLLRDRKRDLQDSLIHFTSFQVNWVMPFHCRRVRVNEQYAFSNFIKT